MNKGERLDRINSTAGTTLKKSRSWRCRYIRDWFSVRGLYSFGVRMYSVRDIELVVDERIARQLSALQPFFLCIEDLPRLLESTYKGMMEKLKNTQATLYHLVCVNGPLWLTFTPLEVFKGLESTAMIFQFQKMPDSIFLLALHTEALHHHYFTVCLEAFNKPITRLMVKQVQEIRSVDDMFLSGQLAQQPSKISFFHDSDLLLTVREYILFTGDRLFSRIEEQILDCMQRHRVYSLNDLAELEPEVIRPWLHVPQLKKIVGNCASLYLASRKNKVRKDLDSVINENESRYPNGDPCKIVSFLNYQQVPLDAFNHSLIDVLFKNSKKNMLVLTGGPSTGKTAFLRPLAKLFVTGEMFPTCGFEMCYDKDLLFGDSMEINAINLPILKRAAEGLPLHMVDEAGEVRTLTPAPIIGTWNRVSNDPNILSRTHYVRFFKPAERHFQSNLCNNPTTSCPRQRVSQNVDDDTRNFWSNYQRRHRHCNAACNHCSYSLCHFEVIESIPECRQLFCYDHGTLHCVNAVSKEPAATSASLPNEDAGILSPVENTLTGEGVGNDDEEEEATFPNVCEIPSSPLLMVKTNPLFRRSARVVTGTAMALITPNDWLAYLSTYVKEYDETHV